VWLDAAAATASSSVATLDDGSMMRCDREAAVEQSKDHARWITGRVLEHVHSFAIHL